MAQTYDIWQFHVLKCMAFYNIWYRIMLKQNVRSYKNIHMEPCNG